MWIWGAMSASAAKWYGVPPPEARAQLRSIQRRLKPAAAERMAACFVEGRLFCYSFYGFTLVNMATADPGNAEFRRLAISELERIIRIVETMASQPPFDMAAQIEPHGGIIAAGHPNLLRAGYVILGGKDERILRAYHDQTAKLSALYAKSRLGVLESYVSCIWPVDNCCAVESIRLHDSIFGTSLSVSKRFAECLATHLDTNTSMMLSQLHDDGTMGGFPRGCSLSWTLAIVPGIAPELAREQYARYRSEWFIHPLGTTGVREWPSGINDVADGDSGPVLCGIGAAASGFGIAAAKANGDVESLTRMLRGMELTAFPVTTLNGEKRYLAGQLILGDILALWGKTLHPWDRPASTALSAWPRLAKATRTFWCALCIAVIIVVLLVARIGFELLAAWRHVRGQWLSGTTWNRTTSIFLGVECAIVIAWLILPSFNWLAALLLVAILDTIDRHLTARRARNP